MAGLHVHEDLDMLADIQAKAKYVLSRGWKPMSKELTVARQHVWWGHRFPPTKIFVVRHELTLFKNFEPALSV